MKTIKIIIKILKGLLLWMAVLVVGITIMGIDSIAENKSLLILFIGSSIVLSILCYIFISWDEAFILSGAKLFNCNDEMK